MKLLKIICYVLLLSACASPGLNKQESNKQDRKRLVEYLPVYGNWCGLDHPKNFTQLSQLTQLSLFAKPVDEIDAACKAHDACYVEKGMFSCECDYALWKSMSDFLQQTDIPKKQNSYAKVIWRYFYVSPCRGDSSFKLRPEVITDEIPDEQFGF